MQLLHTAGTVLGERWRSWPHMILPEHITTGRSAATPLAAPGAAPAAASLNRPIQQPQQSQASAWTFEVVKLKHCYAMPMQGGEPSLCSGV